MANQSKINFDDFKLENIIDPEYKAQGIVDTPEDVVTPEEGDPAPAIDDTKGSSKTAKPVEVPKPVPATTDDPDNDVDDPDMDLEDEEIPTELKAGDGLDLSPFYKLFHEKLGWEIDDKQMPENSIEGLISYMDKITTEASKPQYANEISENFDRYLANGGDPKRFMDTMFGSRDYSSTTLETDSDKKQVLSDYLSKHNPDKPKDWVTKKIQRYEDSGVLDEEAQDALDELKELDTKQKASIVVNQEKQRQEQEKQYQSQLKELETTINGKKDIAGIPVNQKEMKEFYEYLTKVGKDGYTAYEKALSEDREAMIKMAYVAYKKFDVNNLKTNVRTDVVKDVKKALSRFSASNDGLQSRTGLPAKSTKSNYKDFDLGL